MAEVIDVIIRVFGVLFLAITTAASVACLVLDIRHRRRGLERPAPGSGQGRRDNW